MAHEKLVEVMLLFLYDWLELSYIWIIIWWWVVDVWAQGTPSKIYDVSLQQSSPLSNQIP